MAIPEDEHDAETPATEAMDDRTEDTESTSSDPIGGMGDGGSSGGWTHSQSGTGGGHGDHDGASGYKEEVHESPEKHDFQSSTSWDSESSGGSGSVGGESHSKYEDSASESDYSHEEFDVSGTVGGHGQETLEVKPVFVVGVGGTGQAAVKAAKARVRQLTGGSLPQHIIFLVFDTEALRNEGEPMRDAEFANIGKRDLSDFINRLRVKDDDEIYDWFPRDLTPGQISYGAMGIRHFGRLYYFKARDVDVRKRVEEAMRRLMNGRLKESLNQVSDNPRWRLNQSEIEVHLVGSGSGGTGSGLFLDLAYDLRHFARDLGYKVNLFGHLVLPDAFRGKIQKALMPQAENNSYALLCELNHFMDCGEWRVRYQSETVEFDRQAPFNLLYLLGRLGYEVEGADRRLEQIYDAIGSAVADLSLTDHGQDIKRKASNVMGNFLGGRDPVRGMSRAYGSYGVCHGTGNAEEVRSILRNEASRRILDGLLNSPTRVDDHVLPPPDEYFFGTQNSLKRESLKKFGDWNPRWVRTTGSDLEEATNRFNADYERYIKDYIYSERLNWSESIKKWFRPVSVGSVFSKLKDSLFLTYSGNQLDVASVVFNDVSGLVNDLVTYLRKEAKWCRDYRETQQEKRQICEDEQNRKAEKNVYGAGWQSEFAELARKIVQCRVRVEYLGDLEQRFIRAATEIEARVGSVVRLLENTLRSLRRMNSLGDGHRGRGILGGSNGIRFFDEADLVQFARRKDLRGSGSFTSEFIHLLERHSSESFSRVSRQLEQALKDAASSIVARWVEQCGGDREDNMARLICEIAWQNPEACRRRVKKLHQLAQPLVSIVDQLPGGTLVEHQVCGGARTVEIRKLCAEVDADIETFDCVSPDLVMMRFLYGVPLWSVQGTQSWRQSAIEAQTEMKVRGTFLDPKWEGLIEPFCQIDESREDEVWSFTLLVYAGVIGIGRDGRYEYLLPGADSGKSVETGHSNTVFQGLNRRQACRHIVMIRKKRDKYIDVIEEDIRGAKTQLGEGLSLIRNLKQHLGKLDRGIDAAVKLVGDPRKGFRAREDVIMMRDEYEVVRSRMAEAEYALDQEG